MRVSPWLVAGLVAVSAAGCRMANLSEKTARTEAKICAQLAAVDSALAKVAALTPSSTVGQAQAANQALSSSMAALETSEQKLATLRWKAFQRQLKTFRHEESRIAADKKLTLEQAASVLKTKAAPVIAARQQLSAEVSCEPAAAAAAPATPSAPPAAPAKP